MGADKGSQYALWSPRETICDHCRVYLELSFGSRLQVRLNVTWIQVGDAHQEAWPSEGPKFPKAETALQQRQACEHLKSSTIHDLCLPLGSIIFSCLCFLHTLSQPVDEHTNFPEGGWYLLDSGPQELGSSGQSKCC